MLAVLEPKRREALENILAEYLKVKKTIHEPARFAILELLALGNPLDYNGIKDTLRLSDGNLHSHLSKLEEKGYVTSVKGFVGKKPRTEYSLTRSGLTELKQYLATVISTLKTMESRVPHG